MKQKLFAFSVAVAAIFLAHAGNHTIVVRGDVPVESGKTEVSVTDSCSDTLVVTPALDVTYIEVNIKDSEGEILQQEVLPATVPSTTHVNTPVLPDGCILEIRDDNGMVYSEYEP